MGVLTDIWESQKKWDELEKERKRKRREAKLRKKQLENEEVIVDEETGEVIKTESNIIYSGGVLCYRKYDVPEFVEEKPKLKVNGEPTERFRIRYGKYLAFVNFIKYIRSKKYFSILTLAQTSRPLIAIWGSQPQVKTALDELQEMKLIIKDSDSYQKGVAGKSYVYIYENEQKLIEYCKKYKIEAYQVKEFEVLTEEEKTQFLQKFKTKADEDIKDQVKFGSNLYLKRPKGVSVRSFEKTLLGYLMENYPSFAVFTELVKRINDTYYAGNDELKLKFEPKFTWSDRNFKNGTFKNDYAVTKIGIRVSNKLCSAKKGDTLDPKTKVKLRKDVLKRYGFNFCKDITSSVPRVSCALTYGVWIKDEVDLYKKIFYSYKPNGTDEEFKEEREAIKKLLFRTYFDDSDGNLVKNTWNKMVHNVVSHDEVEEHMVKLRRAVEEVLGGITYGSYVFYVESLIYIDALHSLLEKGYDVWLVYDCFYGKGFGTEEEFIEYVLDAVFISFVRFKFALDFRAWDEIYKDEKVK